MCGTHDSYTQLKLLANTKLTFKITYATTQAVEAADKQVKTLHKVMKKFKKCKKVGIEKK